MNDDSELKPLLSVDVAEGKYTVIQAANGATRALRYGEEWRDCCGDGLILALAQRVEELEQEIKEYHDYCSGEILG